MDRNLSNAFVTARKGFCYLTIKHFGRHHDMMCIRAYKLDADEKRHMRRLYLEVAFDWKRITQQLAEKREACRRYRSRSRQPAISGPSHRCERLYGVYDPSSRTVYVNGVPSTAAGVERLLDTLLRLDRERVSAHTPPEPARSSAEQRLAPVRAGRSCKLR